MRELQNRTVEAHLKDLNVRIPRKEAAQGDTNNNSKSGEGFLLSRETAAFLERRDSGGTSESEEARDFIEVYLKKIKSTKDIKSSFYGNDLAFFCDVSKTKM